MRSVIKFTLLFVFISLLIIPTAIAKKPSDNFIPDPNVTFYSQDDLELRDFIISAFQDKIKLKKDEWDWVKKIGKDEFWLESKDNLKYDSNGKLKDPLSNITFRVAPSFIRDKTCVTNQYYSSCTWTEVSFDKFIAKNNITSQVVNPVYPISNWDAFFALILDGKFPTWNGVQEYLVTPIAYEITFSGIIDDLDPEINKVYTSSNLQFANQTEGSNLGARLDSSVLFMNFDNAPEGTYVQDNSINNNFGTNNGATYNTSCDSPAGGNCFKFDGNNDYVSISDTDSLSFTDGAGNDQPFSISQWIYQEDFVNAQALISKYNDGTGPREWLIIYAASNMYIAEYEATGTDSIIRGAPFTSGNYQNKWTHLVVVYNGSETDESHSIYINGVKSDDSSAGSGTYTGMSNGVSPVRIGTRFESAALELPFNGSLDQVQIWDRALTQYEIVELYNGSTTGRNNSDYIGKYSSEGDFKSNVFFNESKTYWNTTMSLADSDFKEDFTRDGLVSWWDFDEDNSTTAIDIQGSNDGTITGAVDKLGIVDRSKGFDSVNALINFTASTLEFESDEPFSFSLWVNEDNVGTTQILIDKFDGSAIGYTWGPASGNLLFTVANTGGAFLQKQANSVLPVGSWSHVAVTYDGSRTAAGVSQYIDGVLITDVTINSDNLDTGTIKNSVPFQIGNRDVTPAIKMNGSLDEVMVYNRSLNSSEVSTIYTEQLKYYGVNTTDENLVSYYPLDRSYDDLVGGNDGIPTGTNNATGISSDAMRFNGDDTIAIPNEASFDIDGDEPMSYSYWIKTTDDSSQVVFDKFDGTKGIFVGVGGTGGLPGKIRFELVNVPVSNHLALRSTTARVDDGKWHHVVNSYDGSEDISGVTMYLDGNSVAMTTLFNTLTGTILNNQVPYIASRDGSSIFLNASLDELIIYNDTLSLTEVQALYKSGLSQHADANITLQTRVASDYNISDPDLAAFWALNNDSTIGEEATLVVDQTRRNNGTAGGTTWFENAGVVGGGLNFTTSSDNITVQDSATIRVQPALAFSFWIKTEDFGATQQTFHKFNGGWHNWNHGIATDRQIQYGVQSQSVNQFPAWVSEKTLVSGEWNHVVMVHDTVTGAEADVTIYINGEDAGISSYTANGYGSNFVIDYGANNIYIGTNTQATAPVKGQMDEIRIYNRSLSSSEVSQLYNLDTIHINWNDTIDSGIMQDGIANNNSGFGKFFQMNPFFNTDNTISSAYLLNHSIGATEQPIPVPSIPCNTTISNCSCLQAIQDAPTLNYELNNSIDCSETTTWNGGQGWEPIGELLSGSFTGSLNGNNFTVSNLYMNLQEASPPGADLSGMFYLLEGNVSNLGLINVSITSTDGAGAFAGGMSGGNINNCYARGNVSGANNDGYGGLVGDFISGSINNSYFIGNVSGVGTVGGIAGDANGGSVVSNSYMAGNLVGTTHTGGIIGNLQGTLTNSFSDINITATTNIGGLVGSLNFPGTIINSYWNNRTDNPSTCYQGGNSGCTAIDNDTSYFQGDVFPGREPMASWDFFTTWEENLTDYSPLTWEDRGGDFSAPTIFNITWANETNIINGTVVKGDNVTITVNVTDTDGVDSVWIKIWDSIADASAVIFEDFLSLIAGDVWGINVTTNASFNVGQNNFTIYANDTLNLTSQQNGTFEMTDKFTSFFAAKFAPDSFVYDTSTYEKQLAFTYNTSAVNENFIILSSLNAENAVLGSGSVEVYVNVTGDADVQLFEGKLRTITWSGNDVDVGSIAIPAINFTIPDAGPHNLSFWFRSVGTPTKPVNISAFDISMGQLKSFENNSVFGQISNLGVTFDNSTYSDIGTLQIDKGVPSATYASNQLTMNASAATIASCFVQDTTSSMESIRSISSSLDVGSVSGTHIWETPSPTFNVTLKCLTTAGVNTQVSGRYINFDLADNQSNTINSFHAGTPNINLSSPQNFSAGTTLIDNVNITYSSAHGDMIFLSYVISIGSVSGEQTPRVFINSSDIPEANCFTEKRRYLEDNDDIGNVKMFYLCENNFIQGTEYEFNAYLEVPAGETATIFSQGFDGIEVTAKDVSTINTPPIVALLNPSENATINGTSYQMNYTIFDPQLDTYLINITISNFSSTTNLATNLLTDNSTFTFDTSAFRNGWWNITVNATENDTVDLFSGFDRHLILISNEQGVLNLLEPQGVYPAKDGVNLNFTTTIQCLQAFYSLNGAANQSVPCSGFSTNTTFNGAIEGMNDFALSVETGVGFLFNFTEFDVNTQENVMIISPREETYSPTEQINITSFCKFTNSTLCGSDISKRVTAWYPNGTLFFASQFMTFREQGRWTYTTSASSIVGQYAGAVVAYDGTPNNQTAAFTFTISDLDPIVPGRLKLFPNPQCFPYTKLGETLDFT